MALEDKARVPKLRFPEFEGDWLTQKLSKVLKKKSARNSVGRFSKSDVLSVSGEHGVVNQIAHLGRSYAGESVEDYHVVDTGDIVYTKSPLKSNPYGIIRANLGRPGIVSTLYAVYQVRSGHSYDFVNRYFESDDRTNKYLRPLVNKGAKNDMKISNERVLIDPVSFPSIAEQKKIAACLSAIDAKIGAVREKEAALARFKRGLMQALFTRTLRFTRDDGSSYPDWEEKLFRDVAEFSKGKGIARSDIAEDGELRCIRYGELYTDYSEIISTVHSRTNLPASELILSKQYDVIIPASGEDRLDMARACCVLEKDVALGGDINIIRSDFNGPFLAYYLSNAKRKEIARFAQGNSVVHLYGTQLKQLTIAVPHPDEQQKIVNALSGLDARLTAAKKEITRLERYKAGLLQQMFV